MTWGLIQSNDVSQVYLCVFCKASECIAYLLGVKKSTCTMETLKKNERTAAAVYLKLQLYFKKCSCNCKLQL